MGRIQESSDVRGRLMPRKLTKEEAVLAADIQREEDKAYPPNSFLSTEVLPDKEHFLVCAECLRTGKGQINCYCPCHDRACPVCKKPQSWHHSGVFCKEVEE